MRLGHDESGSGEPLVLLHGVGTSRAVWRRALPLLAEKRRVFAIDVPGFGDSPPAGNGFDLAEVAGALGDGLADLDLEQPFDLCGHSLGGAVALRFAAERPRAVRRLVLGAPAGFAPRTEPLAQVLGIGAEALVAVRRQAGLRMVGTTAGRRALMTGPVADGAALSEDDARLMLDASRGAKRIRSGVAAAVRADMRPALRALRSPLGLLWGERDRVIGPRTAARIQWIRPHVPLQIIPGVGHVPMVEDPLAYRTALESLLGKLEATPVTAR